VQRKKYNDLSQKLIASLSQNQKETSELKKQIRLLENQIKDFNSLEKTKSSSEIQEESPKKTPKLTDSDKKARISFQTERKFQDVLK
jgi:hypothetical protein